MPNYLIERKGLVIVIILLLIFLAIIPYKSNVLNYNILINDKKTIKYNMASNIF